MKFSLKFPARKNDRSSSGDSPTVRPRRWAFTMMEVIVGAFIAAVVLLATIELFVTVGRAFSKNSAKANAIEGTGNGTAFLADQLAEAYAIVLPSDTTPYTLWNVTGLGAVANYRSPNSGSVAGWPTNLDTAVYIAFPPAGSATVESTGGADIAMTGGNLPSDRAGVTITRTMLVYRGNIDETYNPNTGTCLWAWTYTISGGTTTVAKRLVTRDMSSAWNALYFQRATNNGARQIVFKLTGGDEAYNSAEQTSENFSGDGDRVTLLSGRAVSLANTAVQLQSSIPFPSDPNLIPDDNTSPTPAPTPTPVPTPTPRPTPTPVPTPTPRATPTPRPTPTPVPTPTPRATPTPRPTPTPPPINLG